EAALAMACVDARVDMGGLDIELGPKATLSLSLLLHELATNALKYGAFSNPLGRAQLVWSTEHGVFHLAWIESGGPRVSEPTRKGFGSRLIQMGLGVGSVRTEFDPDGFSLELSAPLSHLQSDS
ncbi:MAG: histidine kinase, partial [Luteibacter sp.]